MSVYAAYNCSTVNAKFVVKWYMQLSWAICVLKLFYLENKRCSLTWKLLNKDFTGDKTYAIIRMCTCGRLRVLLPKWWWRRSLAGKTHMTLRYYCKEVLSYRPKPNTRSVGAGSTVHLLRRPCDGMSLTIWPGAIPRAVSESANQIQSQFWFQWLPFQVNSEYPPVPSQFRFQCP